MPLLPTAKTAPKPNRRVSTTLRHLRWEITEYSFLSRVAC